MEFEFPTYQINEDMTPVQPRIVISRPLTVDVMIQVDTENLSALGMFTPNFVLTVMKISSSLCHNYDSHTISQMPCVCIEIS